MLSLFLKNPGKQYTFSLLIPWKNMPLSQTFLEKFAEISVNTLYDEKNLIIYKFYFFVYNVSVCLCNYEVVSATQNQEFVQTRFFPKSENDLFSLCFHSTSIGSILSTIILITDHSRLFLCMRK